MREADGITTELDVNGNRLQVREGHTIQWPTRTIMFKTEAPAAGDIIVCFYAPAGTEKPGICGIGLITKFLPKSRKFDWLPLPPTNILKKEPWWDESVQEICDLVRKRSPRGTMYSLPGVLDAVIRRGVFAWAQS